MEPYLKRLAQLFVRQQGGQLTELTFVFPNRRASLFFRKYIGMASPAPVFAPETITINQCFEMLSGMQPADHLSLLFKLYRLYQAETNTDEPFDQFIYWGNMLLSDFDEIDKYLIPAQQLFSNLNDWKRLDNHFDYLTETQKEAIERFWNDFDADEKREHRRKFLHIWQHLYPVYERMHQEMLSEQRAYQGFLQRQVIEQAETGQLDAAVAGKQFVFIGFNALTPCETALMTWLQKNGKADFYWDAEAPETTDPDNLAAKFIHDNAKRFPSSMQLPPDDTESRPHGRHADINLIPVASNIGQTTCIYNLLRTLHPAGGQTDPTQTAIVLPDENLLMPMLHAIPDSIGQINVTMGYPLKNTAVFALMEHLFELQQKKQADKQGQNRFYHKCVLKILAHPYINALCPGLAEQTVQEIVEKNMNYIPQSYFAGKPVLETIFATQTDAAGTLAYLQGILKLLLAHPFPDKNDRNHLYQYYQTVNRVGDLLAQADAPNDLSVETLCMLLHELAAGVNIPFTGEPLNGLQIMGTLETRGLDFRNLIIASMNEGVFPKTQSANSFIPYELRRGFGLPTAELQNAMFAYNFYRLIYRAENIYFLYDTRTDGLKNGEPSRFIQQLQFQYNCRLNTMDTTRQPATSKPRNIQIAKTPDVQQLLSRFCTQDAPDVRYLSASALNTYINCPLQFYLLYVKRIEETPRVRETIEADMFGTILHAAMQQIYQPYEGKIVEAGAITRILNNENAIEQAVLYAYTREYLADKSGAIIEPAGRDQLITSVIKKYINLLLEYDKKLTPFTYVQSECKCNNTISLPDGRKVNIKGFIDRVDSKDGITRIVDYKTGKSELGFSDISQLFTHEKPKDRPKYVLQTFLYAWLYQSQSHTQEPIAPHIYSLRKISDDDFPTQVYQQKDKRTRIDVDDFRLYADEFLEGLTALLDEIFNPEIAFGQCADTYPCERCAFRSICQR